MISPLTALLKQNSIWNWTADCDDAFNLIKEHLATATILTCLDFEQSFVLQTDVSAYGIGAVFIQQVNGQEKIICFLSHSLSQRERNYITTDCEWHTVIWAVEKLRRYLENVRFTVLTDHWSFIWLSRLKGPTRRLASWAFRLQPFNFIIIHRKIVVAHSIWLSFTECKSSNGNWAHSTTWLSVM